VQGIAFREPGRYEAALGAARAAGPAHVKALDLAPILHVMAYLNSSGPSAFTWRDDNHRHYDDATLLYLALRTEAWVLWWAAGVEVDYAELALPSKIAFVAEHMDAAPVPEGTPTASKTVRLALQTMGPRRADTALKRIPRPEVPPR
jgi:hypothetical protein